MPGRPPGQCVFSVHLKIPKVRTTAAVHPKTSDAAGVISKTRRRFFGLTGQIGLSHPQPRKVTHAHGDTANMESHTYVVKNPMSKPLRSQLFQSRRIQKEVCKPRIETHSFHYLVINLDAKHHQTPVAPDVLDSLAGVPMMACNVPNRTLNTVGMVLAGENSIVRLRVYQWLISYVCLTPSSYQLWTIDACRS